MKRIICKLIGHHRRAGWFGDGLYGRVVLSGYDGVGLLHAYIEAECDRCGQDYTLARFHPNQKSILAHIAKWSPEDLRAAQETNNDAG